MKITPVNIWNNIERVWVLRLDIVYEGNTIVGIHHSDFKDAIKEINTLCKKLQQYRSELEVFYNIKPPEKRSMIATYIYLMRNYANGLCKIGRSIKPEFREKTIQSEIPQIKIIFKSQLTENTKEKELHKIFKEKRVRGEWFDLSESDIHFIKTFNYAS